MLHAIESFFTHLAELISAFGYWGIGVGMLIESACIPLPSEVVLPYGGYLVSIGKIDNLLVANIAVNIGSMIGSLLAYGVGYFGGRPFILKYGKYFFVSEKHFYKAENTFNKYGVAAVFFGRLLPVIRTFISLPAGIAGMKLKKFMLYSLIGMIPWNFLLIFLGYKLGKNFEDALVPIFDKFKYIVIGAIILALMVIIARSLLHKKREQ